MHNNDRRQILPDYGPHMPANETWFEKLMREADEAGEFDDLPGSGKPIADLDRPYDPAWWAKKWMQRETVAEAARDVATKVRREIPRILAGVNEDLMRRQLGDLNREIEHVNGRLPDVDRLPLLDVEGMIIGRASRPADS